MLAAKQWETVTKQAGVDDRRLSQIPFLDKTIPAACIGNYSSG